MHALPYWRLSGYYFFYFAFVGAFSPYFGLYLQSLSFSAWDIGLLMSQMQLMRLCAPFLWGALADHLAQRMAVVRLAALLSLIGFAGFFAVQGFVPVLLAMALLAFFWSAALPLVETVTFDHLRDQSGRYSRIRPVSYTHLDVYKRQVLDFTAILTRQRNPCPATPSVPCLP